MEYEKLYEILTSDNIIDLINNNLEELLKIIPEIKDMIGFEHKHPYHFLDVWNHTLYALSISENDFEIRLCLLLHDIGKPHSYIEGEIRHFYNHASVSSIVADNILKRLNFNDDDRKEICYLIKMHDTMITDEDIKENKKLAIKRFKVQVYDTLAHNKEKIGKRKEILLEINKKINTIEDEEKYIKILKG